MRLGYNELHLAPQVTERIDRLLLCGHVVRRCTPLLNLLEEPPVVAEPQRACG